jgi:hypothetical protein
MFFLKAGWIDLPFWLQAWKFVKCFPEMMARAEKAGRGDSFLVAINGKIT